MCEKLASGEVGGEAYPEVNTSRCTGCGRCVAACRDRLFALEVAGYRKHAFLRWPQRCSRCLDCVGACPVGALSFPSGDGDDGSPPR